MQPGIPNKQLFHALLIILLGLVIYSNTYDVPFHFDDYPIIKQSESLLETFSFSDFIKQNRAVGYLSFWLNYAVHGRSVGGYHVVNIAIHLANGLLLYLLVILSCRTPLLRETVPHDRACAIALISSLLFICHPVQTQAVTYIVQRFTSLAVMFYLLAVVLYLEARTSGRRYFRIASYIVSLLSAVIAMKTKEIAFTLPFAVGAYEAMFFSGKKSKRWAFISPYLLMLLIIPLGLIGAYDAGRDIVRDIEMATRVHTTLARYPYFLTELRVVATYLRIMFLPVNQNLDYDYPIYHSLHEPAIFLSLLLLLGLIGTAWRLRRSIGADRLLSFGIVWFMISLSVESGVIPIKDVIFEHRLYLPSAGLFVALAVLLVPATAQNSATHRRPGSAVAWIIAALIIMLSITAYTRNRVWQSEMAIWQDVSVKAPRKERGHYNLARQYRLKGMNKEAIAEYELAAAYSDNAHESSDTYNNLGRLYDELGLTAQAEAAYRRSVELNSTNSIAFNNLGLIFMRQHLLDNAITQFRRSIEIDPAYAKAHANLGRALAQKGFYSEAEQELKRASELGLELQGISISLP